MSTNPTADLSEPASPVAKPSAAGASRAQWGGLSLSAWMKIGAIAVLMALLFRFNLRRLWLKTNPFTGQENWGHAFFIPLIGLYYLYVHREDLTAPHPVEAQKGSIGLLWGIFQLGAIAVGVFLWAAFPGVLDWLEAGVSYLGLIAEYHGWRIAPLYLFLAYLAATAGAAMFLSRHPERARRLTHWAAAAWPVLGVWFMLVLAAWGRASSSISPRNRFSARSDWGWPSRRWRHWRGSSYALAMGSRP